MIAPCERTPEGDIAGNSSFVYPDELRDRIRAYYSRYYEHFGIRNVSDHVDWRLRDESIECERLARHESLLRRRFTAGRALIVGSGAGGLAVCLHALGNEVHGIEPDPTALEIARSRMAFVGGEKAHLLRSVAEGLPYRTDTFDFVFCYTVLEHVRDVHASLREMVRVLKPGGVFLLNTPEYRFPFEMHYKVPVLLKPLPRILSAVLLKLAGKPMRPLFDEITYVTSKQLQHLLMEMPHLRFFRVFESYPPEWRRDRRELSFKFRLTYAAFRFWSRRLEIYNNQEYYVFKEAP